MNNKPIDGVNTLTFDLFGTVLDLAGSLTPRIEEFLAQRESPVDAAGFWAQWRLRQRVEQYQDTILMLGHSGYLTACKYAFLYTLRANNIAFTREEADDFMQVWQQLKPFEDAVNGLSRLKGHYRLVGLSNGEPWYLDHLAKNRIKFDFDAVISVEEAGAFKPHPGVYRKAAQILDAEVGELMMVASHSFDIMGARACGYRAAYVNRYGLPMEETPHQPDIVTVDFGQLADYLIDGIAPTLPDTLPYKEE
ncbi:MAG: haloacid dehalogenase type II [Chloroflexi bacterium]|nr:haloacid dehalogenase type II [Chloroflexota bacterium]